MKAALDAATVVSNDGLYSTKEVSTLSFPWISFPLNKFSRCMREGVIILLREVLAL